MKPFRVERASLFSRYASFERDVDVLTEQDLAVPRLAAERAATLQTVPIAVSGALGKSDLAQGQHNLGRCRRQIPTSDLARATRRSASTQPAHRDGHFDRALCRVGDRHQVVEEHSPSPENWSSTLRWLTSGPSAP